MHQHITTRILEHLPNKPYASKGKSSTGGLSLRVCNQSHAIKQPYIQVNPPTMCAWLIFDVDHSNIYQFEEAGLPLPNWIAATPSTKKHHIAYAVEPVCTSINARPKPLSYLAAIQRAYTFNLEADNRYTGLITKNPFSDDWQVQLLHSHIHTLGELADYVSLTDLPPKIDFDTSLGRNCHLFDIVRKWAYRNILKCSCANQFALATRNYAIEVNSNFEMPLSINETQGIAASVSKWTWQHKSDFLSRQHKNIGIMSELGFIDNAMSLTQKQQVAAGYTNNKRLDKTISTLNSAVNRLVEADTKVTKAQVSKLSGVSYATVKRRWNDLDLGIQF